MTATKLTYFGFDGGRGEDSRLALHIAGVDFEDDRIRVPQWPELKANSLFGSLPILEVEGKGRLGQSTAILTYIGRSHGLHPTDLWEAARHEALMAYTEELRERLSPTLYMKDQDEKRRTREELASGYMQKWGANVEAQLAGPFVGGDELSVADLKLFMVVRWFTSGVIDHVPTDVFKAFPKLMSLFESVGAHDGVKSWYALRAAAAE